MYASMEEILNAVAAGELTPEEADREIEALQARPDRARSRARGAASRASTAGTSARTSRAACAGSWAEASRTACTSAGT